MIVAGVVAVAEGRVWWHLVTHDTKWRSIRGCGETFQVGDVVALAQEGHIVVQRLSHFRPSGRVMTVRGWHEDRLRVDFLADESVLVDISPAVRAGQPREGDKVLVQEEWKVALEIVERANVPRCDQVDSLSFDQIGGLDDVIEDLLLAVEARFLYPELAAEIGLEPLGGVILAGPPGSGKTMLVRTLVDHVKRKHGRRVGFENVARDRGAIRTTGSPTTRSSSRYATEQRLADGEVDLMILFYDELDTLGSRSSEVTSRIDGRVLNALLHKIDGITARRSDD